MGRRGGVRPKQFFQRQIHAFNKSTAGVVSAEKRTLDAVNQLLFLPPAGPSVAGGHFRPILEPKTSHSPLGVGSDRFEAIGKVRGCEGRGKLNSRETGGRRAAQLPALGVRHIGFTGPRLKVCAGPKGPKNGPSCPRIAPKICNKYQKNCIPSFYFAQ